MAPTTPNFQILVRIDEIPVRGLKLFIGGSLLSPFKLVRIDEIPVRGLKLKSCHAANKSCTLVRIDEIPVRGLKQIRGTYPLG